MADIKDMSREEIEQYLASMPKDTSEPSAKQETTAAETMRGADGNYDVSKVNINKMFVDKANERGYTDNTTGERKSYNKGSKWQAKIDELPEDARNYIYQRLNEYKSKGRPLNKWDLREIEHSAKAKFGLPRSFDISSNAMFDKTMAKILNKINMPKTGAVPATEKPAEQKPVEQSSSTTNDELNDAFKRIKNKQASDADFALFNKYSEEQLKKMGFGPISIATIKGNKEAEQTLQPNNTLDDDTFINQYNQYTQQLSGVQPNDPAGVKAMQESEPYKFINDPANVKRYQDIMKKRNLAKNSDKIEKLKQELEMHKKIMADNPVRKDIQDAQQAWVDLITKKIEELGGSVE